MDFRSIASKDLDAPVDAGRKPLDTQFPFAQAWKQFYRFDRFKANLKESLAEYLIFSWNNLSAPRRI